KTSWKVMARPSWEVLSAWDFASGMAQLEFNDLNLSSPLGVFGVGVDFAQVHPTPLPLSANSAGRSTRKGSHLFAMTCHDWDMMRLPKAKKKKLRSQVNTGSDKQEKTELS